MAAELQPPEASITTATVSITATEATPAEATTAPTITTTATTTSTGPSYNEKAGTSLAPKRQRRPSVRLGEIGEQAATLSYETHVRRATKHPWRLPKDSSAPSSKANKARSLTNLVNGGGVFQDNQEFEERDNQNGEGHTEFGNRKAKAKRATTTKRVRSNWVLRGDDGTEGDSREDGDEEFRDLSPDSDSPLKDHSPLHTVDNVALDLWHGYRRPIGKNRVLGSRENDAAEFDNVPESDSRYRKCRTSEGVRSWLIELGLSRYSPMFEIHEVDDEVLPMLTLEDLKDMGINAVGSRRKMLHYHVIYSIKLWLVPSHNN
ncbi:protein bicaudal C-like 1-A-like [Quillaja saponaria]|uniref:Protein bicaudal C-like 1-A-like n=1 Tax=Quillaja saponaria TaxID=32244 RepID=A0AAD7PJH4_QUISA|nr:protein bicaudal C-like 1-A-like [Quillaja saponaria]